jgi:hypothetical protein
VEPGGVQGHTILPGFDRTEGIARGLPAVLEFADGLGLPLGLALTPQALRLLDFDLAGHDVGLHLHPQDPVLSRAVAGVVSTTHDCLGRYRPEDQARLLAASREIFETRMGRPPRLFVAGRWSEDAATGALLRKEGFTHDASALPGHRSPCADWSRVPRLAQPYAPAADDYQARGSEPLVQIPVFQGLWGHHFTPETVFDLGVAYFEAALHEAKVGGADVVHTYLHSPLGLHPPSLSAFQAILEFAQDRLGLAFVRPTNVVPSSRPRSRPFPPAYWARMDLTLAKSLASREHFARRSTGTQAAESAGGGVPPAEGEPPESPGGP